MTLVAGLLGPRQRKVSDCDHLPHLRDTAVAMSTAIRLTNLAIEP